MKRDKENQKSFSVLVLLYNTKITKVYATLQSVIDQEFKDFEIIIADDGSSTDLSKPIAEFLEKHNFSDFKFTEQKENVGTVENILDGLKICTGKYIKAIGAGDLLFCPITLGNVYSFMEQNEYEFIFGLLRGYHYDTQNGFHQYPFYSPKDIKVYKDGNIKICKKNVLIFGDWISGASMFFKRSFFKYYLEKLSGVVKYCEDVLTANVLLDDGKIGFLDETVVWYEVGEGVSTSDPDSPIVKKIQADQKSYFEILQKEYPEETYVKRGLRLMKFNNQRKKLWFRLMRNILEPSRIGYAFKINCQKKENCHWKEEIGFLNIKDFGK